MEGRVEGKLEGKVGAKGGGKGLREWMEGRGKCGLRGGG